MTLDVAALAKPWVEPVSAEAPAGTSARFDPNYEQTVREVAKLEMPGAPPVNWKQVLEIGGELLKTRSKDLLIAAHVSGALVELKGLEGLATGLTILADLHEKYWEAMHPEVKRLRGRANALGWYVDRMRLVLTDRNVNGNDRPAVEAAEAAAKRLHDLVREKFGAEAPALRPLTEAIERLKMNLPPPPPPPPDPTTAPPPLPASLAPGAAVTPASSTTPAPAAAAAPAGPTLPAIGENADATAVLREYGTALVRAAGELRRRDNTQAGPYRALRAGLWLHFLAPPPATGGKTQLPAPPAATRQKFEMLAGNAKWPELLQESEAALPQFRFWLDLNRFSAHALANLGATHAAAREALIVEVASLLRRFPTLVELSFTDGTAFADGTTRAWLSEQVLPQGSTIAAAPAAAADQDDSEAEARKLVAGGKADEAIKLMTGAVSRAPNASKRFSARLSLARTCLDAGQPALARAIYDGLDSDQKHHDLEEWEPALVARCLEGLLLSLRALAKSGKATAQDVAMVYDRLCRLEPAAALRLGG